MENMKHYNNLKAVPRDALKEIGFGKLKGKSDINPQYRYEAMTQEFGVCGIGWKYDIVKTWTQPANDGQVMVFVEIALYIKDGDSWGGGIPAIGGDFLLEKDKNGLHGNDEAYKMATTDALGVAMKMLGVAADVYRGLANDSKYGREKPTHIQTPSQPNKTAPVTTQATTQPTIEMITPPQLQKLQILVKENGLSVDDVKAIMAWKYKIDSSKKLTKVQAGYMIENINKLWTDYIAEQSKEKAVTA